MVEIQIINKSKLVVFDKNGVSFEECLRKAKDLNLIIASNKRIDLALNSDEWKQISEGLWCWTGTMVAYAPPDQKLGEKVEYSDPNTGYKWTFPVPKEHQDKTNVALVAEHPDYILEIDGKKRIIRVPEDKVGILLGFPVSDGWYLTDQSYGIPTKENGDETVGKRCLRTTDKRSARVGPVVRGYQGFGDGIENDVIDINNRPSDVLGMIVEIAEAKKSKENTDSK